MEEGTSNIELDNYAKILNIKNYIPCRMKDELIGKHTSNNECGIINTKSSDHIGIHWNLIYVDDKRKIFYSSYGDYPDQILLDYLGDNIFTSSNQIQTFDGDDKNDCGLYCIIILYLLSKGYEFENIIIALMKKLN